MTNLRCSAVLLQALKLTRREKECLQYPHTRIVSEKFEIYTLEPTGRALVKLFRLAGSYSDCTFSETPWAKGTV